MNLDSKIGCVCTKVRGINTSVNCVLLTYIVFQKPPNNM